MRGHVSRDACIPLGHLQHDAIGVTNTRH